MRACWDGKGEDQNNSAERCAWRGHTCYGVSCEEGWWSHAVKEWSCGTRKVQWHGSGAPADHKGTRKAKPSTFPCSKCLTLVQCPSQ